MKAIVSGGAGFIGSNLVDALVEGGHQVVVIDDLSTGRRENVTEALERGAELAVTDVRDAGAIREVFDRARPEVVFHLAAQIDVRHSVADPARDARINVEGTVNMLAAAHAAGARRFVNTSTGAAYGEGRVIPAPEDHPVVSEAPYGLSKICAEHYCSLFSRMHSLSTVSLRYSNVYGPRQDPHGESGVVAVFCGQLAEGVRPTVIGDGLQTRDYAYVDDVVRANLRAASSDREGPFNVSTGRQTSVLELGEAVARLAGRPFEPAHAPERLGEVRHIALDPTRARRELGWDPEVELERGLRRTFELLA